MNEVSIHTESLDRVSEVGKRLAAYLREHPELFELLDEYSKAREEASKDVKNLAQTNGQCRYTSSEGDVSGNVDIRKDIDGDKFISVYGQRLLNEAPRALKVTKSGLMEVGFECDDLDKFLEPPKFVATVTSKDKAIKALIKKLDYLMEALGIDSPENEDELDSWYAIYEGIRRASRE